ncbi:MAG: sigma-70 family RNA polymerase sigma factor [Dehalococcoidia bacterium]
MRSQVTVTSGPSIDPIEQEWVAQAQRGDVLAFNAIVERYQQAAYNLALRMLRDPSAAEDATQDAFFSAYRNIGKFRGGSLRSWILTILANGVRDTLRSPSRRRQTSLDEYIEDGDPGGPWEHPGASPEDEALRSETSRQVREALAQLPEEQRLIITLVDLQQLDYEEAAQVTGLNLGTVKSRLFRGRKRLAELLRPLWELSEQAPRQNA